jgi:hypothetical protein
MQKRRLEEDSGEVVAQSSVDEAREAHQVSEAREEVSRELVSSSKGVEATSITTTEAVEAEEVDEDSAGGTMISHSGIETLR